RGGDAVALDRARQRLRRAHREGERLAMGTGSAALHGPTVQQELRQWVEAGIPPALALQAATGNAAELTGAAHRIGRIETGYEANLLLVDGNPLVDIAAVERISLVIFKGERVRRARLLEPK
ncbi:MAG: amidohydrolase family protein, partial [Bryobacteraceae bacterium]